MDNILNPITAYRKERNWSLSDSAAHAAGEHPGGAKRIAPVLTPYKKDTRVGVFFRWAMRDSNPHSCGYENVDNFEIPFFL